MCQHLKTAGRKTPLTILKCPEPLEHFCNGQIRKKGTFLIKNNQAVGMYGKVTEFFFPMLLLNSLSPELLVYAMVFSFFFFFAFIHFICFIWKCWYGFSLLNLPAPSHVRNSWRCNSSLEDSSHSAYIVIQ